MSGLLRATSIAAFGFVAIFLAAACSPSGDKTPGQVKIVEPWTMATPPGASVGAGYMRIVNEGAAPVRLTGGVTPAAETVEIHMMSMDGGIMQMRPASEGLEIPARGEVELKPGGFHLMLIGLKKPLSEGESVPITLVFDGGLHVEAALAVRAMGGGYGH